MIQKYILAFLSVTCLFIYSINHAQPIRVNASRKKISTFTQQSTIVARAGDYQLHKNGDVTHCMHDIVFKHDGQVTHKGKLLGPAQSRKHARKCINSLQSLQADDFFISMMKQNIAIPMSLYGRTEADQEITTTAHTALATMGHSNPTSIKVFELSLDETGKPTRIEGVSMGNKAIWINKNIPSALREYACYHECTHLTQGHFFKPELSEKEKEEQADCMAIDALRQLNKHDTITAHIAQLEKGKKLELKASSKTPTSALQERGYPTFSARHQYTYNHIKKHADNQKILSAFTTLPTTDNPTTLT